MTPEISLWRYYHHYHVLYIPIALLLLPFPRKKLFSTTAVMIKPKGIVAIIGTTGVGKSKLGVQLGKAINGEIVNVDSMQVNIL